MLKSMQIKIIFIYISVQILDMLSIGKLLWVKYSIFGSFSDSAVGSDHNTRIYDTGLLWGSVGWCRKGGNDDKYDKILW